MDDVKLNKNWSTFVDAVAINPKPPVYIKDISMNKPIVTSGATYRFYNRPEGWSAACEVMDQHVSVSFYKTECEAIAALNKALGQAGLMKYRFNGGEV